MIRNNREKFCGDIVHWGYNWSHFQVAIAINVRGLSINNKKFSQFCQLQGDWQTLHLSYRWNNIATKSYLVTICWVHMECYWKIFYKMTVYNQYMLKCLKMCQTYMSVHIYIYVAGRIWTNNKTKAYIWRFLILSLFVKQVLYEVIKTATGWLNLYTQVWNLFSWWKYKS